MRAKMPREKKARYMISVVAEMFELHPQTLRLYEREGLVKPERTGGNTRLYSEDDLEDIRRILHLTRDLGVNLAGVEVILGMRRRIEELRRENEQLLESLRAELQREVRRVESRGALVHVPREKPGGVRET